MENEVEFRYYIDRWPKPVGDVVTLAAKIKTPRGKRFLVVLHEQATIERMDGLEIRRIDENGELVPGETEEVISWIKDSYETNDMFASELFGELTGKYAFEVKETVKPEVTRHSSKELREFVLV